MSKFLAIAKGTRSVLPIEVPFGDTVIACGVRPMIAAEEASALAGATVFAVGKGISDPKPEHALYELALRAHVIAIACVDLESAGQSEPYFASADEVMAHLDRDRIALIHEKQQSWQDHCSVRQSAMGKDEFWNTILGCAQGVEESDRFLSESRPVLRASFTASICSLLLDSPEARHFYGSGPTPSH